MNNLKESLVGYHHQQIMTTSLDIAEHFGKQHKHVVRDIKKLLSEIIVNAPKIGLIKAENSSQKDVSEPKIGLAKQKTTASKQLFFVGDYYKDGRGRLKPMWQISRDGFALLAMGFTGEKALKWKLNYINAFNQMESILTEQKDQRLASIKQGLFTKHSQWQETKDLREFGFSTKEISIMQGKHQTNVQKMLSRIRKAGISLLIKPVLAH